MAHAPCHRCRTRAVLISLRIRWVYQARRHLPPAHLLSSMAQRQPLAKVSGEGIEVEIEPVTGKERDAERRPGSVGAYG